MPKRSSGAGSSTPSSNTDTAAAATPPTADRPPTKLTTAPTPEGAPRLHALEKWTPRVVHRSQLKNAEYNPRTISAEAKRRLRALLKKIGLRGPPTWNVRSGNIVGGHQRIAALDALSTTGADYSLTVAEIDVGPKEEREINLAFNNAAAQGEFDLEKLEAIMKEGIDVEAAGWVEADMFRLFGDVQTKGPEDGEAAKESVRKALDQILEVERATEDAKKAAIERDREDFYLVVVFRSYAERKAFTDSRGLEDNRYQSAESFGPQAAE